MTLSINSNSNFPASESSKRSKAHHRKGPEKEPFISRLNSNFSISNFLIVKNPLNNRIVNISLNNLIINRLKTSFSIKL